MHFIAQQRREFEVGFGEKIQITDCGKILLEPDEQVSFVTEGGAEYDITRKEWGFYATPSINRRLASFGLKTVLVKNSIGRLFVLLVEEGKKEDFLRYAASEQMDILCWLDSDEAVEGIKKN